MAPTKGPIWTPSLQMTHLFVLLSQLVIVSSTNDYLSSIPRSQLCSTETSPTGSLHDDLSRLQGDGDACIYRIHGTYDDQSRIKLKLHETFILGDCTETDHVYIFADGLPYGPYCTKSDKAARHRRYSNYDPSRYTNFDSETGNPDGLLTDQASGDRTLMETQAVDEIVNNLTNKLQLNDTDGADSGEVEGTFKANEVDVVYVTAPGGYKFRFQFNFEWELIHVPGNGTVPMNASSLDYPTGSYAPQYYVPQFDQFGIPYEYTAKCDISQFTDPSEYILKRDLEHAVDGEYATKFF